MRCAYQVLLVSLAALVSSSSAVVARDQRPVISDGERAVATIQVQNLMSKSQYYDSAGANLEAIKDLWVAEGGPNAKSAVFFASAYSIAGSKSKGWVMQGIPAIKKFYGEEHRAAVQASFKQLQRVYPELAGLDPETAAIGGEFAMHTNTTPIIEIAGDGKTAKAVWYSPGVGLVPIVKGQTVRVGSIFFWEKYAVDFIKENGSWKIWHLGMSYDYTPAFPDSMTAHLGKGIQEGTGDSLGEGGEAPPPMDLHGEKGTLTRAQIEAGGMLPYPYLREPWSPIRKNMIDPALPEPYYTFSETFSYAPYDSNHYRNFKGGGE